MTFSRFLSTLLLAASIAMPAAALEPEVATVAAEIADRIAIVMQPISSVGGNRRAANQAAFTTSLTFLRSGYQPLDSNCVPALRTQFEGQVKLLSREIMQPIEILAPGTAATVTFVIGDVVGKNADLSEMPLGRWADEAQRDSERSSIRIKNLDMEGGKKNILSGVYQSADGALIHGSAVFDWDSSYVYLEAERAIWNCHFNFLQQIVWLHSLDLKERLRAELLEVEAWASQRSGANDDPDLFRGVRIRTEIGYLIAANVFCLQLLGSKYGKEDIRRCAIGVATSMLAQRK